MSVMGFKNLSRKSEWKGPRKICRHWYNGNVEMLLKGMYPEGVY